MVIEKWYNRWLRQITIVFPSRTYIALSPWYFEVYCNIFLPNIDEDQKKVSPAECGAPVSRLLILG